MCIQLIPDGGFIIAGHSVSNDGEVSGHHESFFQTYDCWIVKLDSNQNIVWQKSLGGSDFDYAYSVGQTSDGGFIVPGSSISLNGDVSGNHGLYDGWIFKLDSAGDLAWQKSLGGSSYDFLYSVKQTPDSGYLIAGTTRSNDDDVSGNHGWDDYWIVKLSSDIATATTSPSNNLISLSPNPVQNLLTINYHLHPLLPLLLCMICREEK